MARPRTDLVPRIVRAARARFLAEGVDGASLRDIARGARTSVGMVFYYFPTKDDLFLAAIEDIYGRVARELTDALESQGPLRARLERTFLRLGTLSDDELAVMRLMIREALLSSKRWRRVLARVQRGHIDALVAALARGQAEGELDARLPLPLVVAATVGIGGVPQLMRRAAGRALPMFEALGPRVLARASAELLFKAVGPAATRRSA
ncbi:MAG TPA: TetR/AcrR family transcriptional regulator [Myxococcales bacterium]|nr:TetR/AcrR family transcriptional regulator [Myxococcales bacterium]